ncbi:hypothetical protein C8F01DRAFT_1127146 [Mycena amicta]|nr:hypothetical protein C8F01DRAFT_1127146 [Mycena amicta]
MSPSYISSIPTELLIDIFRFTQPSTAGPFGARTPVYILTAVCSHWRGIAHTLPELWNDIRIHDRNLSKTAVHLLDECLLRSRELPLHISLRTNDVTYAGMANFLSVVATLWLTAVVRRWKSVKLALTKTHLAALHPFGRKSPMLLEFLELRLLKAAVVEGDETQQTPARPLISFGAMHNLKSFIAERIDLDVSEASFARHLTTLDLFWTFSPGICERMVERLAYERSLEDPDSSPPLPPPPIPSLRTLRLAGPIPRPILASPHFRTSILPCVTTLELVLTPSHELRQFAPHMQAMQSTLTSLTLNDIMFSMFLHLLQNQPGIRIFTQVRTLCVQRIDWNMQSEALCTLFPSIRTLILREIRFRQAAVFLGSFAALSGTAIGRVVLPELRCLCLQGNAFGLQEIRRFVEQRMMNLGLLALQHPQNSEVNTSEIADIPPAPIETSSLEPKAGPLQLELVVDEPPVANLDALRWLREHITVFKMVPK